VVAQFAVVEAPEGVAVFVPVVAAEPEGAAGKGDLPLVGIDAGGGGEVAVDRLEASGDRVVNDDEVARAIGGRVSK
jgi:hypothetical protein